MNAKTTKRKKTCFNWLNSLLNETLSGATRGTTKCFGCTAEAAETVNFSLRSSWTSNLFLSQIFSHNEMQLTMFMRRLPLARFDRICACHKSLRTKARVFVHQYRIPLCTRHELDDSCDSVVDKAPSDKIKKLMRRGSVSVNEILYQPWPHKNQIYSEAVTKRFLFAYLGIPFSFCLLIVQTLRSSFRQVQCAFSPRWKFDFREKTKDYRARCDKEIFTPH